MKKIILTIIVGIFLLASLQNVFALGVTPGRTTVFNLDNSTQIYSFTILNSEKENINLSISSSGELAKGIKLEKNYYELKSNETSKTINYYFNLPANLTPGKHTGAITISESGGEYATFGAKLAVSTEIVVFIPYPSKYVESDLDVFSKENNSTTFLIPLINYGSEKIENVRGIIDIYQQGKKVTTISTNTISLDSMKRGEISANWQANELLGRYKAMVILMYDNETSNFSRDFQIGNFSIDVFDLFFEDFELGSIVQMGILVENKWDTELKEVYANLLLYNDSGKIVDIASPPIDIPASSKTRIPLYWDTSGISEGKYYGKIIMNYKEFSSERKLSVDISKYGIGFELESGEFIFETQVNSLKTALLFLFIIVIIGIIYVLFMKNNLFYRQKAYK